MKERIYGYEGDLWSVGIMIYQLIVGRYPYDTSNAEKFLYDIQNFNFQKHLGLFRDVDSDIKEAMKICFKIDYRERRIENIKLDWAKSFSAEKRKLWTPLYDYYIANRYY